MNYIVDICFRDYKLAIAVDKYWHGGRNIDYKTKRQKAIKKELICELIRINPDEKNFNEKKTVNKIYRHIKKLTGKCLINNISRTPLELKFK